MGCSEPTSAGGAATQPGEHNLESLWSSNRAAAHGCMDKIRLDSKIPFFPRKTLPSVLIPLEFELLPGALINICHAEVAHPPIWPGEFTLSADVGRKILLKA